MYKRGSLECIDAQGLQSVYSLWMCPPMSISDKIRMLIQDLAMKYNTVPFEPHVLC